MRNIKLLIEYDGTNYAGWQKQKNALAVEEVVEKAISMLTREQIKLIGSSRTDTGVHAKGFVANFLTSCNIPSNKFKNAINNKLPKDIVILSSEEVKDSFHARYSSKGKTYCYTIVNSENSIAIGRNYIYHYKHDLDIDAMKSAAKYFLGTHDFVAFKNVGSSVKSTTRTITQLDILTEGSKIDIIISADGFLYNMVRIIVGTLIDVGIYKKKPKDIIDIINSKDRTKAGKSAPPQGLCLLKVYY